MKTQQARKEAIAKQLGNVKNRAPMVVYLTLFILAVISGTAGVLLLIYYILYRLGIIFELTWMWGSVLLLFFIIVVSTSLVWGLGNRILFGSLRQIKDASKAVAAGDFTQRLKPAKEKETAERAERERKEAAERAEQKRKEAEAAELARIKAKEELEAWRAEQREQHQKALLINIFFGIFFTLLSIYAYCSLLPDKFTGLILGLILGIGITIIRITSSWGYFDDFKEYLARLAGSIALGALVSAWLAFMADAFFTDTFVTPFSILSAILTPTASICPKKV